MSHRALNDGAKPISFLVRIINWRKKSVLLLFPKYSLDPNIRGGLRGFFCLLHKKQGEEGEICFWNHIGGARMLIWSEKEILP